MVKILQNVKIKTLSKLPAVCSINIEFCSAQAKIFMILCKLTVWLISILLFIAFYWLITTFGIVLYVIIGVPPKAAQFTSIRISTIDNY